jgi:DNA-binding IclR family transcriptional regulator
VTARHATRTRGVACPPMTNADRPEQTSTDPPRPRLIGSVLKSLRLVDELAGSPQPLGVADIARMVGGTRGSVYQQLQTLAAAGWVERTERSTYRLTLRALHIGAAALDQADLGSRVNPTLRDLAAASQENSAIAVLDGRDALIAQRVEGTQQLRADIKVGTRMPLARSASGRVLVAFGPEREAERLRAEGVELPSEEILAAARANGYAWQLDELEIGMASVAVPVTGVTEVGLLALSLTAPSARFDLERSLVLLMPAAQELTHLLEGRTG